MKPLHKLIIIALFFAIIQQSYSAASPFADKELCKLEEPGTNQNTMTQALSITGISISQNTCVQRFTLDLDSVPFKNQKYIYIEVQFNPFPDPSPPFRMFLLEGDEYQPIIYEKVVNSVRGLYEDVTDDDSDAWINSKPFHRVVLNSANIKKGGMRYFAVYKLFQDITLYPQDSHLVSYTITPRVSTSTEFECLNNCNGQGSCDSKLQQCICYSGFFGFDCSVSALRLNAGLPRSQTVPAKNSAYYYTSYQSEDDVLSFRFKLNKPDWNVAVQFNKPNDFSINSRDAFKLYNTYPLSVLEFSQDFSALQIPRLKEYVGGEVLVFISNPTDDPMYSTVQVDYPEVKEKSKLLLTIAIVAGIVLFLIVLGAFITAKCRARAARSARSIELGVAQGEPGQRAPGQRGQRANRANPQQQQPVFLTKADIEKYFPLKQFSDLKTGFLQSACSICLDEFAPNSKCHQLYCEHIFHDNCIESWLAKQSNCPNCKSEMDKKSIRKFLKERSNPQKSAKPNENKPVSQQIELNIHPGNHQNGQPEQAEQEDRGNLENSVYENSEENPIELQSPIGSPVGSPHSSRMLAGDRYGQNL